MKRIVCSKCNSERIAHLTAKTGELCCTSITGAHGAYYALENHTPLDLGVSSYRDYLEFSWCLDCGQLQGSWPVPITEIEKGNG